MESRRRLEKELEKLSQAIIKAVTSSKDVLNILKKLQAEEVICRESLLVLMLRMHSLNEGTKKSSKRSKKKKRAIIPYLEGKELTANELAFEEYKRKHFKEKEWLKKMRLIF